MRIMVACGGTGGHIFPGLAVAGELRARGADVTILLAGKKVERTALAGWDGPVMTVPARGLAGHSPGAVLSAAWWMFKAFRQWRRRLRATPPDVLLAMGSYASGGPVWAARCLGVPVVLHEANVIPGRAVRWLARWAQAVALGFDETRAYLRHPRLVLTGIPLRRPKAAAAPDDQLNALQPDCFTLLVMGGSAGARRLNEIIPAALAQLQAQGRLLQVIHLAGTADAETVTRFYAQNPGNPPAAVYRFLHDMPQAYRRASLAVCRAGAATCAELLQFGVPALLIPYPHAAGDHQMANARAMEKYGAADVLAEATAASAGLADYIARAMDDPARLARMRQAALAHAAPDAAARVADLVMEIAQRHAGQTA